MATVYEFNYVYGEQKVVLPPGKYLLECWGAAGGGGSKITDTNLRSKGGYSKGELMLKKETTLYVYTGGNGYSSYSTIFNGGGDTRISESTSSGGSIYCGGGGATDIRLVGGSWNNEQGLLSRIIVAGGAGRNNFEKKGGDGGGETGGEGIYANSGATQISGGKGTSGTDGSFGKGGKFISAETGKNHGGGGGGWFGGGSGVQGGGGSGYIFKNGSYTPVGYIPTKEYWLENATTTTGGGIAGGDGKAKITLLQGFPFITINSCTSLQTTFIASHTEENKLSKIEWFIDDILKETFTTDLYLEKTINYELTDNAIHTLKIVVTDLNGIIAEKVLSISKSIMPLEDDASLQDVASKVSEMKDGLINGKTSIVNVLGLKNIESSLNNTLVELSEKVKESFDSGDASVQELQNQLTEKNNNITQLNRTISSLQQEVNSRVQFYKKTYLINTFGTGIEEGGYKSMRYGENFFLLPFKPRYIVITSTAPNDVYIGNTFLVYYIYSFDVDGSFSPTNSDLGFLNVTNSKVIDESCYPFISTNPESLGKTMIKLNCYGSGNSYVSNITVYAFS
ncbi:hypothetical protein JY742_18070 [Clostridioides difficile]|nr:hypothetical protein [Clostridioides difficile]